MRRYKNEDWTKSNPQNGQPKKLSEREERSVLRKIKQNPRLSASTLAASVREEFGKQISANTIRIIMKKEGFNGRVCRKKPYINEVNRKKRQHFPKEHAHKDQS